MNKTTLEKEIKRYVENEDFETAKNLAKSFGPQIQGFDIEKAVEKIGKQEKEVK